jgi:hypothetical protein
MRNTKDVEIFGRSVTISERNAQEVLELAEFANKQEMTAVMSIYISAIALQDSLKHHKKWYQRFTAKKLLKGLTQKEIFEYMALILELEGVDNKKKVVEAGSAEVL